MTKLYLYNNRQGYVLCGFTRTERNPGDFGPEAEITAQEVRTVIAQASQYLEEAG